MASTLTDRLSRLVKTMRGQARITENNVQDMLREVRMALLEADVALPVVKEFVEKVKLRAVGQEVQRSLTLTDRDMFVDEAQGQVAGYLIAQPISPLLVPVAHDIRKIGVIDDFYHADFAEINAEANEGSCAANLLQAAESAFTARQVEATFVVCPAGWPSKISILAQQGYQPAKVWLLKEP